MVICSRHTTLSITSDVLLLLRTSLASRLTQGTDAGNWYTCTTMYGLLPNNLNYRQLHSLTQLFSVWSPAQHCLCDHARSIDRGDKGLNL